MSLGRTWCDYFQGESKDITPGFLDTSSSFLNDCIGA